MLILYGYIMLFWQVYSLRERFLNSGIGSPFSVLPSYFALNSEGLACQNPIFSYTKI